MRRLMCLICAAVVVAACSGSDGQGAVTLATQSFPPVTAPPTTTTTPPSTTAAPVTSLTDPAPEAPASTVLETTTSSPDSYDTAQLSELFGPATARVSIDECGELASGSGFAISDRHVVTNAHVVGPDPSPDLLLRDGRTVTSSLIGIDQQLDIAVLEVPSGTFSVTAAWGDSASVFIGQAVTIIGYPAPLTEYDVVTVSVRGISDGGIRVTEGTDAGNSGSAVFDEQGRVVGVIRAVLLGKYAVSGVVIPSASAKAATDAMIASPTTYRSPCDDGTPTVPGFDAEGTWLMQLGSAASDADNDAVTAQVDSLAELAPGVRTLLSSDWPGTFDVPGRIIFYVGGFASRDEVVAECERIGLIVPDQCLARFLE